MLKKLYLLIPICLLFLLIFSSKQSYALEIKSISYDKSVYFENEEVIAKVTLVNKSSFPKTAWLGYSLRSPDDKWIDIEPQKVSLLANQSQTVMMKYKLKTDITGSYTSVFALWDSFPITQASKRLANFEQEAAFSYFKTQETFEKFNDAIWLKREGMLNQTMLTEDNVQIKNNKLCIELPKNKLEGGELQSKSEVGFGAYEVYMKLPNAPSTITGFFLYKQPDFHHEIDIEVFNKPESEVFFTTYEENGIKNNHKIPLDFDPTASFHKYRIEFYEHKVSFFIDNKLYYEVTQGFSKEKMYLILNAWYPHWLESTPADYDSSLLVEWIRY